MTEQEKYEALENFLDSVGEKKSVPFTLVDAFIDSQKGEISPEDVIDYLVANGITVIGFQKDFRPKSARKDDPLWLYIKEVGKVKILGKERELEVAIQLEKALHAIRSTITMNTMFLAHLIKVSKLVDTHDLPLDEFTKATSGDPLATTEEKRNDVMVLIGDIDSKLREVRKLIVKSRAKGENPATQSRKMKKLHSEIEDEIEKLELTSRALERMNDIFYKVRNTHHTLESRLDALAAITKIDKEKFRKLLDSSINNKENDLTLAKRIKVSESVVKEAKILRRRELRIRKRLEETSIVPFEKLIEMLDSLENHWAKFEECKRLLIEANVRLVINIAKNYTNQGVEFLDLIQEGNAALIKAVERFDPSRGYKLGTYAIWWIRQAMLRTLAEQSHVVKLPTYLVQWIRRYARVAQDLSQKLGREPSPQEVSDALDVTPAKSRKMRKFFTGQVSLNKSLGDDDSRTLEEVIADESSSSPTNLANLTMLQNELKRILESLTPKEQRVISLRFGLEDNYPRTLEEIGQIFDLSRERIRQIEMKALSKLRHPSKLEKLLPYLRE